MGAGLGHTAGTRLAGRERWEFIPGLQTGTSQSLISPPAPPNVTQVRVGLRGPHTGPAPSCSQVCDATVAVGVCPGSPVCTGRRVLLLLTEQRKEHTHPHTHPHTHLARAAHHVIVSKATFELNTLMFQHANFSTEHANV